MLHKSILFEQQVKRRRDTRPSYGAPKPSLSREKRPSYPKENKPSFKTEVSTPGTNQDSQGKEKEAVWKSKEVRCFKCHGWGHYASECSNERIMVLLDNGDTETAGEESSSDEHEEKPIHESSWHP